MDNVAQTIVNITGLTTGALVNGAQYEVNAVISCQIQGGTQGMQWAIQSSTGAGTFEGQLWSVQTSSADSAKRMSVVGGIQIGAMQAGDNAVEINGIYVSSGTPTLTVQCKGIQASMKNSIRPLSYMKITRIL